MPTILAIDTSTDACSVALLADGVLIERITQEPRVHAKRCLPFVDDVLKEADLRLPEVDALAFARGPGSFTGLRICAGIVQGLAFAADLPVVSVSTLAALALTTLGPEGQAPEELNGTGMPDTGTTIVPMLDARMHEIYVGAYRVANGGLELVSPERVCPPRTLSLEAMPDIIAGSGLHYLSELEHCIGQDTRLVANAFPTAGAVARLALAELEAGNTLTAEQVQPVYLRDEVTWKKLPGRE